MIKGEVSLSSARVCVRAHTRMLKIENYVRII